MTLEQAIAILSDSANAGVMTFDQRFRYAERLLIEAGKQVLFCRSIPEGKTHNLLPGETKN